MVCELEPHCIAPSGSTGDTIGEIVPVMCTYIHVHAFVARVHVHHCNKVAI